MMSAVYFLLGAVVVAVLISIIAGRIHQKELRYHSGISREEFEQFFRKKGVPGEIANTVYDHYKAVSSARDFCPAPDHSLEKVYWSGDEDINDEVQQILEELKIDEPENLWHEAWTGGEVRTVGDVVDLIHRISNKHAERKIKISITIKRIHPSYPAFIPLIPVPVFKIRARPCNPC
jgi:hypothetical protein